MGIEESVTYDINRWAIVIFKKCPRIIYYGDNLRRGIRFFRE
jgi:hypothetical protein